MKIQLSANWKHDCYYYYLKKGKTFPISISNVKLEFRISCRYKNRHMIYNVPPLLPKFRKLSTPLSPGTGCLLYGGVPRSKPQKGGPSSAIIAQARHEITFVAAPRDRPPSASRIVSLHPPWNPRNCAICGAQVWWAEGKKIRPRFQYLRNAPRAEQNSSMTLARVKIMNGHIIASWQRDAPRHDTSLYRYDLR